MTFNFENALIDLLLSPLVQNGFQIMELEDLLLQHYESFNFYQVHDVIQILFKCIDELRKIERENVITSMFLSLYVLSLSNMYITSLTLKTCIVL